MKIYGHFNDSFNINSLFIHSKGLHSIVLLSLQQAILTNLLSFWDKCLCMWMSECVNNLAEHVKHSHSSTENIYMKIYENLIYDPQHRRIFQALWIIKRQLHAWHISFLTFESDLTETLGKKWLWHYHPFRLQWILLNSTTIRYLRSSFDGFIVCIVSVIDQHHLSYEKLLENWTQLYNRTQLTSFDG